MEGPPEINPPSGRVPGQVHRAVPILESSWQRNRGEDREKKRLPRVSVTGEINRPKGAPGGVPATQAPSWRGQEGGSARWPPGRGGGPLWPSFGLLKASVMLVIYIFLLEFLGHYKYGYKHAIHRHHQT